MGTSSTQQIRLAHRLSKMHILLITATWISCDLPSVAGYQQGPGKLSAGRLDYMICPARGGAEDEAP